jgi:sugar transferase (PEP-CTERM system associated)
VVVSSLLLGTLLRYREDSFLVLNYEYGYPKILAITLLALLLSHWFDLYDLAHFATKGELYFRLLLVPGLLALGFGVIGALFPGIMLGHSSTLLGLILLTVASLAWRSTYSWLAQQPYLRDRVYVLGAGERAEKLVRGLRTRPDLGVDVIGWTGEIGGIPNREAMAWHLEAVAVDRNIDYVIVAMQDSRDAMPVSQLLHLRLQRAVRIEEATSWLERISGKIELDNLRPSWIIFANGFSSSEVSKLGRRFLNFAVGLISLVIAAPFVPLIILLIKLDSAGPVLYRQQRVGRKGIFLCYKFRTMRPNAEADTGPTWADDDDPRITRVGKFLRITRLDEIPQLWCVLKGDMAFVGPRPERPEFVEWLNREIPYYSLRHLVRPGITGWAQIRYKYGNTLADAKEKLQYDLFYIKNASIGLDVLIMFQTIKILLLRRGGQ